MHFRIPADPRSPRSRADLALKRGRAKRSTLRSHCCHDYPYEDVLCIALGLPLILYIALPQTPYSPLLFRPRYMPPGPGFQSRADDWPITSLLSSRRSGSHSLKRANPGALSWKIVLVRHDRRSINRQREKELLGPSPGNSNTI